MIDALELTNGETLLLRRRRSGLTAELEARHRGVSLYRYYRWERDQERGPRAAVGRVALFERSFLLRRRAGTTVEAFAKRVGVSPWWLSQMEAGTVSDDRLRAFWARAAAAGQRKTRRKA